MEDKNSLRDLLLLLLLILHHANQDARTNNSMFLKTGTWCRFNDEDVNEMKSKTLELGKEEDLEGFLLLPLLFSHIIVKKKEI